MPLKTHKEERSDSLLIIDFNLGDNWLFATLYMIVSISLFSMFAFQRFRQSVALPRAVYHMSLVCNPVKQGCSK